MENAMQNSATIGAVISLLAYGLGTLMKKKWKLGIFNPLLIAIFIVIAFLLTFNISYDTYNSSAHYLSYLLTPATVSLAIPLHKQMNILKKNAAAILISLVAGVLISLTSVLLLSILFHLPHSMYVTLLPKSITTAIGMGVSEELGGSGTISAAVIIVTGVIGNMILEPFCRIFHIKNRISIGLAAGASSHAIGTAKAMELGEVEGAMSSLAIVVSGLLTVCFVSFFAALY